MVLAASLFTPSTPPIVLSGRIKASFMHSLGTASKALLTCYFFPETTPPFPGHLSSLSSSAFSETQFLSRSRQSPRHPPWSPLSQHLCIGEPSP